MKELNALERLAKINAENWEPVTQAETKEILAIADAYWDMKRRAEAAEAKLAAARGVKKSWQERAWKAEEKLAELEKHQPMAYRWESPVNGKICYDGIKPLGVISQPLYLRPAPAINLAELVPEEKSTDIDYAYYPLTKARHEGWNSFRSAILRNIEEKT